MNDKHLQPPRMTLLFVCVADEWIKEVLESAETLQWTVTHAVFETYISGRRRPHFPESLRSSDGCVALIDFDTDPEQAGAAAAYLQQVFRERLTIMALSEQNHAPTMLVAMRAGCTELLQKPLRSVPLHNALQVAQQHLLDRTLSPRAAGSVLSLLGAKGGVGTTTLGVHLAVYLARKQKTRVLLIDSKLQFGHVCIYLGMDGTGWHFQEVVNNVHRLDSELLRAFVGHHGSGLDLLSSPDVGQIAGALHPDDVVATLDFLRTEYDFIVVDCDNSGDEVTRAILAASAQVYLVATPDITAIRDLSRHVDDLSKNESALQVEVVINRFSSQFAVSLGEIEKAIRMPVSYSIPNNYIELVRSANLGEPVPAEGKSGFTTELLRWADALVGATAAQPQVGYASAAKRRLWEPIKNFLPAHLRAATATSVAGKRA